MVAVRHAYVTARTGDRIQYRSRKLAYITDSQAKQSKVFPYDVPYLTSKEVWKLVSLSRQYWLSDVAMYRLRHEFRLPEKVLSSLRPLHSPNGRMRFFEEDFWHEVNHHIGMVAANKWKEQIERAATEGFLRQKTAQWTEERANAHLQDEDIIKKRASVHPDLWDLYLKYQDAGRPMTEAQLRRWIDIKRLEENLTPPTWFINQTPQKNRTQKTLQALWEQELTSQGVDIGKARQSHYRLFQDAQKDLL